MNKLYFLFILCLTITSAQADWNIFPLNQKSYYRYSEIHSNIEKIHFIAFDTLVQRTGFQSVFMNRKYNGNGIEQCYAELCDVNTSNPGYVWAQPELDSLIHTGDTIRYSSKLYFLPGINIGDSWRVSGTLYNGFSDIVFTCTSLSVQNFLGVTDSVKEFTISTYDGINLVNSSLTGYSFRLSKNYGFLEYPSFIQLEQHRLESRYLIGFSDSSATHGFQAPTYLDFFPYQIGDILNWTTESHPNWGPQEFFYVRDSIIDVNINLDTLKYTAIRKGYDPTSGVHSNIIADIIYSVDQFKSITECPTNWFVINTINNFAYPDFSVTDSYTVEQDSSISYRINEQGIQINASTCQLLYTPDATQHFIYNTKQGYVEYCYDAFYYNCIKLTGSFINGVLYGDTLLKTGIDIISVDKLIDIYPNPATDKLCISLLTRSAQKSKVEIANLSGSIVYSDIAELSESTCSKEINLSQFTNGFYVLTVSDIGTYKVARKKFVVQH